MCMISVLGLKDKASVAHVYLWYVWNSFSNTFSLGKAVLSPSFNLAVLEGRYVHQSVRFSFRIALDMRFSWKQPGVKKRRQLREI